MLAHTVELSLQHGSYDGRARSARVVRTILNRRCDSPAHQSSMGERPATDEQCANPRNQHPPGDWL